MGFEDNFEIREKHYGNYPDNRYYDNRRQYGNIRPDFHQGGDQLNWLIILDKIRNNRKLKLFIIIACLLVLTLVIVLLIVLLPLMVKLINSLSQIGLQGILKEITGFIENILKGTKS
jgi:hypothetical protein